ncbi:hypothetical protein [Breoghania sp.]|uniref:hypothetical protein n=1 Tax=Breoghania sp. TaxID=2065378 RepID=UPI002AA7097D|nr:hypothetical protein [Breoghania sp.]
MRKLVTLVLIAAAISMASLAHAASDEPNPVDPDRYTLHETADGWLRLERETGRVSLCRAKYGRWTCVPVPDASAAYEAEAKALEDERDRLKARVSDLEARLEAAGIDASKEPGNGAGNGTVTPKAERKEPLITPEEERELDRFMEFSERAMRRFFGMVKTLRREFDDRI